MKTKVNFKFLVALGIMLLAVLVFNMNTVNATTDTIEKLQEELNNIPSTIDTGMSSTEAVYYGFLSSELEDIIQQKVLETMTSDVSDYTIEIDFGDGTDNQLLDITNVCIRLTSKDTYNVIASKVIKVTYNDKNYNEDDKNYIATKYKTLNESITVTIDLEEDFDEVVNKALINDDSIKMTVGTGEAGFEGGSFYRFIFSKNNVIYYINNQSVKINMIHTITIPSNVADTEQAIIDYALPKVQNIFTGADITLTIKEGNEKYPYILMVNDEEEIFVIKDKNTTTETETVTKTDSITNIKLEASEGVIPTDTVLEVNAITEGETYNTVKTVLSSVNNFKVFDITLKSNGVVIQPNGNVKISIPIPSEFDTSNLVVYRVEDDGTKIKYDVTVENGYAVFETDHFSTYVLAELAETSTETNNKGEKDETPKTGTTDIIGYVLAITVLAGVGIVAVKKTSK